MNVLLDMDGVLVDFIGGFFHDHIRRRGQAGWTPMKNPDKGKWFDITPEQWDRLGYEFWKDLPWTKLGSQILDLAEQIFDRDGIYLCTSPCKTDGCLEGKRAWIEKNLDPHYHRRFIMTPQKHVLAHPGNLLIDDHDDNVRKFRAAGGYAHLVPEHLNSRCDEKLTLPLLCKEWMQIKTEMQSPKPSALWTLPAELVRPPQARPDISDSAVYCGHANEVPHVCPCPSDCYCRIHGGCGERKIA
jgi:5'(3')-deoxyribonucleotidase